MGMSNIDPTDLRIQLEVLGSDLNMLKRNLVNKSKC